MSNDGPVREAKTARGRFLFRARPEALARPETWAFSALWPGFSFRRAPEPVERAAASQRRADNSPNAKVSHSDHGRATEKIGAFAGVSGLTVELARHHAVPESTKSVCPSMLAAQ
jgi:hypothetical protein